MSRKVKEGDRCVLYFVVPCYDEEKCLKETTRCLKKKISNLVRAKAISSESKIVYIDDGSRDKTWQLIEQMGDEVIGVKLSKNQGHQNALMAGLMYAKDHCDVAISMDADLQDDIDVVDDFLAEYKEGAEIVYGVRSERKKDSFFKKHTALMFYWLMEKFGANTVYNHADYRLMSKRALEELANYREVNLFLRGIVPLIGLKTSVVKYKRAERFAGESKYPFKKMMNFALDGITSFSVKPIRLVFCFGLIVFLISLAVLVYAFIMKIVGNVVSGWTFTICSIWLLGGVQMVAIGVIGEYIGKIYSEVKARPRYIIEKIKDGGKSDDEERGKK
ncbi:glycosyltransferase family 2 protein [Candidatus Saccharibacteria bacterium]|nr:glycosyltransferase family 2 protein [Candidatus Saccharibacteria bacterium]